jgi:hypothetical protein
MADFVTMICQQLSAKFTRYPFVDFPTPAAGYFIGWDSAGVSLQNYAVSGATTFAASAFMAIVNAGASVAAGLRNYAGVSLPSDILSHVDTDIAASRAGVSTAIAIDHDSDGTHKAGYVCQIVQTQAGTTDSTATAIPYDDTIPIVTEGKEFISLAITPKHPANTLIIEALVYITSNASSHVVGALFQDAGVTAIHVTQFVDSTDLMHPMALRYVMTAGTSALTTFKINGGANAGTCYYNCVAGARKYGGVLRSSMKITEVIV